MQELPRHQLRPMSNERLRHALQTAGLQSEEFADLMDVDQKTARRWLSGSTPTSRHRARAIQILRERVDSDISEQELWPDTAASPIGDDSRDLIAIYARSDDVRVPDWRTLLQSAQAAVDLLDTTLVDVLTATGTIDLLIDKARNGTQIRVITSHPASISLTLLADPHGQADRDENRQTQLDRELALSHSYLERLHHQPGIQLLSHWAEPGPSILRFDDDMLATVPLHARQENERPLLHLRRRVSDGLFDRHVAHLDAVANDAEPIEPAAFPRGSETT